MRTNLVSVFEPEIVVLDVELEVRKDELQRVGNVEQFGHLNNRYEYGDALLHVSSSR
jgi:hypothetical protein